MTRTRIRLVWLHPAAPSPIRPFVVFSLGAHAVFVAALVLFPSLRGSAAPRIDPSMPIRLVGPAARPEPQTIASPPAAEPVPAEPAQPPEGVQVSAEEPAKPKPEPPEKKKPPAAQPPQPAPQPVDGGPYRGSDAEIAGGITALDGSAVNIDWYTNGVYAALHAHWTPPPLPAVGDQVEVTVSFVILRDGSTRDVQVVSSSGIPSLDRSALRAVMQATLPPLPPSITDRSANATWTFAPDRN